MRGLLVLIQLLLIKSHLLAGPLIRFFKSNGCTVLHKCTTIRHAKVSGHYVALNQVFNRVIISRLLGWE